TTLERLYAIRERLAREHASDAVFLFDLFMCHINLGSLFDKMGRPADAMASREQARAIRERLARGPPAGRQFPAHAAIDLDELRFDKAREEILQAIEWRRKLLAADPQDANSQRLLADHLTLLIRAAQGLGRTEEADEAARERDALRAGAAAK